MNNPYKIMSDEEYNKIGGYRSTGVKQIIKYGMFDYLNPEGVKRGGVALDFGIMFHKLVLEFDSFKEDYSMPLEVEYPEFKNMNKNRTDYKDAKKRYDLECLGSIPLDMDDYAKALNMRDVVMRRYGKIIERSLKEIVFSYTDENKITRNCKVDIYDEQTGNFFDLKSSGEEINLDNVRYVSSKYGYDTSYAWYYDAIKGAGGDANKFGLLFSSKADFRALLYKPSNFFLEIGRQKYGKAYDLILDYEQNGNVNDAYIELDPTFNDLVKYGYAEK